MSYSLNALYDQAGISKQAVAQYDQRQQLFDSLMLQLLLEADDLRQEHPGCGVEKMYGSLNPDFIGRDRFIETMMSLGYRLKRNKNYKRTTIAGVKFYPNLIKGLEVKGPSQVWQSDITYIPIGDRHCYATFIIDVYTKKIVGYHVTDHMRATANVQALRMALKTNAAPTIHHSDRGSQYTYKEYVELLRSQGSQISMALSAQDNAYAERINKTMKEEYLNHWKPQSLVELKKMLSKAVYHYNHKRHHRSLGKISPINFEKSLSFIEPDKRKILTIFNNEILI